MQDRDAEVHVNRMKNSVSSISILPGGQDAETRFNLTLKRDASQREISDMERSFGGISRSSLMGRPVINRNKSSVEIGDTRTTPSFDYFRKENV